MYRYACSRLKETPSFDAFRLLYKIRDSTNCWSIGRRDSAIGLVSGSPKLDSPWYREYLFARPTGQSYSGGTAPPTEYAVGSKESWCSSTQYSSAVRDHVDRLIEGFHLRVYPSGSGSAYEHVRDFYGLRALADAVRPKKKKVVVKVSDPRGAGPSMTAAGAVKVVVPPQRQGTPSSPGAVTRGAGKRLMEPSVPVNLAKRSRTNSPRSKVGENRGKAVSPSVKVTQVDLPPQAATDGEAAELAFHTICDQLVMPPEYTASSSGNSKRLAGTATQFFFAAQIGFSQILMNNDRLSKTVDDQAVEIAKLKKSSSEGREALLGEIRPLVEREYEERLARKDKELSLGREAVRKAQEERDQLQERAKKSSEMEKLLLEEQESLRKEVEALKLEKAALQVNHQAELETARAEAGPAYLESAEFQAMDNEKYKTIVGNAVATIRHWFRMDQPEAVWSTDEIWDAVGAWTDADVNSENEEEGSPVADGGGDDGPRDS
ncbi:unnamed protein product [Linum trigynum]|uniref:Uncharacterized protein n=1 Tax=Linum trigynum TaxID=586398 RepID=A0AAV2CBI2_9ROSI